jgi:hypothetical protein
VDSSGYGIRFGWVVSVGVLQLTIVVNKVFLVLLFSELTVRFGAWKNIACYRWVMIAAIATATDATLVAVAATMAMVAAGTPMAVAAAAAPVPFTSAVPVSATAPVTIAAMAVAATAPALPVAAAVTLAAAAAGVPVAATAAVRPRRWWFGGAPAVGFGAVGQRPLRRLLCTWPMVCASRLRRSGLWCVSGFGCQLSRTCTG